MKRISKVTGMLGLAGFAVITGSFAETNAPKEESFWYGGFNLGRSAAIIEQKKIMSKLQGIGLNTTDMSNADRDNAYKLFGGYQVNKNFALEAGYFDLGKFGYTATTVPAGTLNGNIQLRGLNLDAVGILPINEKYSAFGRLGLQYTQTQDHFSSSGAVVVLSDPNPSKNGVDIKAGVGLQYDFNESLGMRVEAERFRVDDAVGSIGEINMYSLGLVYRFGQGKPAKAAPVAAPAVVIVPVIAKTQQYCSILDLQFEIKMNEIQREDKEKLAVVGTFMNKYPDTTAVIEGHSDNVGTEDYNLKLSQRRADSVVSYLVDDLHIAASRLKAVGYGYSRPIADNNTREGQQANRRINAVIACATDIADLKVAPARLTMAMEIEFDPFKADIQPQYYDQLGKVAEYMKANPAVTATVEGHAGKTVGLGAEKTRVTQEQAMDVSQKRAQSVVEYLVDKLGVSRSRLATAQFGQTRRVAYGTSLEGQQENRRVNIIFNYSAK